MNSIKIDDCVFMKKFKVFGIITYISTLEEIAVVKVDPKYGLTYGLTELCSNLEKICNPKEEHAIRLKTAGNQLDLIKSHS